MTPDFDMYEEELSLANSDLIDFEFLGPSPHPPARIPAARIYGFAPMDPGDLADYIQRGQVMADALKAARGIPAAPGVPAAAPGVVAAPVAPAPLGGALGAAPVAAKDVGAPAAGPAAVAVTYCWVSVEDAGGRKRGDIVVQDPQGLPPGHVVLGDRGVVPGLAVGEGPCLVQRVPVDDAPRFKLADLRVLPVSFDSQGVRRKEFNLAVAQMNDAEPMGGGLQLDGPTTVLNVAKNLRDQAMTPTSFHEFWLRTADIPKGDRSVYEHECLSRVMESLVTIDQLNLAALQGAELICRRMQVIREAHRVSPTNPDYSSADYFMGWRYRRGAHAVDNQLAAHVAKEMRDDAAILKEARKAKEEAQNRRRPPKQGGGEAK